MMLQPRPRRRRRPGLAFAAAVAVLATAAAYVAMVGFATDTVGMSAGTAYAFAGVLELSLVTVALMAREAAQDDRPNGTLLTLTWVLSGASGSFSGWHELAQGHGPVAAVFRVTVPLLAALMWHLALVGDRHIASGRTFAEVRAVRRGRGILRAAEAASRPVKVSRAERRLLRARAAAIASADPEDMVRLVRSQVSALIEQTQPGLSVESHESRTASPATDTETVAETATETPSETQREKRPPATRRPRRPKKSTAVDVDKVHEAWNEGLPVAEIVERLGISKATAYRHRPVEEVTA